MRILFMGTSNFAIPALKELILHSFNVIGVVTQPDRPSGRGKKLTAPPVKEFAIAKKLRVYQPEKVRAKSFIEQLIELAPDVIVVAAFGQLLPQRILDIPPSGVINLHPSILPKYRGAAPIQWTLINGEKETGITLMLLDAGEDTGNIICNERITIELEDTAETLHNKLACIGASLLVELLTDLPGGELPVSHPQIHADATYAPRLTKEIGKIDWNESASNIQNLVRGTIGWPGAYTYFREGILLKLIQTQPYGILNRVKSKSPDQQPGALQISADKKLLVITGNGLLEILQVQPATKKVMDAQDFVNGYQIKIGECFFSN